MVDNLATQNCLQKNLLLMHWVITIFLEIFEFLVCISFRWTSRLTWIRQKLFNFAWLRII